MENKILNNIGKIELISYKKINKNKIKKIVYYIKVVLKIYQVYKLNNKNYYHKLNKPFI